MSRIGKLPVVIPAGVTVTLKDNVVSVKGPKGEMSQYVDPSIIVEVKSSIDDFVYDSKWQAYLPYCTKFFFAADEETIAYIKGCYSFPEMGFLTLRTWKDISPYHVVELKSAKRHTWGVFADPKFLLRLVKSNCLFLKGFYKGIRKVDKRLVSDKYDQTKHISKTILLDTDDK